MEQLKMWWIRKEVKPVMLPEGYSVRRFDGTEKDIDAWVDICKNGLLGPDAGREAFQSTMVEYQDLDVRNIIFIVHGDNAVATVTPVVHDGGLGYVHMVACRPDQRGKGLGNALNRLVMRFLYDAGCDRAYLTTDDFRLAAVKSYLSADFMPVLYGDEAQMERRWADVFEKLGVDEIQAVDDNGAFVKTIRRSGLRG